MAPHDKNNQINLLLNLILREYDHWYYFDLVPRYDDELAAYMQARSSTAFVKITGKANGIIIYYPLDYHALTGFHLFGHEPGLREAGTDQITIIKPEVALNHLLRDIYPELSKQALQQKLQGPGTAYETLVSQELQDYIPASWLMKGLENPRMETNYAGWKIAEKHASLLFFNEFGDPDSCSLLKGAIHSLARNLDIDDAEAAGLWAAHYMAKLLEVTLNFYIQERILVSPAYLHTGICLDKQGLPEELVFTDDVPTLNLELLPAHFNRRKLESFLAAQLLAHHIYPLIRNIGLCGFLAEATLLETLDELVSGLGATYGVQLDFLQSNRLKVSARLPQLLDQNQDNEYAHRHIHLHNHLINTRHYVPELIKPTPGGLLHKRYFNGGELEIGIRAFNPATDIEILHRWVNLEYSKQFWEMEGPIRDLEEAYIKHLGVDYSHPYIGTLNGEPIFTLELYWAIKDEVGKYYPFGAGDYGFHMLIAPAEQRIPNFSYYALTMCMEHFFSFDKLDRMIGEASAAHMGTHNLITKVGCEFEKALVLPYKTSNLTFCVREQFEEAVKDVLERSCTEIFVNI